MSSGWARSRALASCRRTCFWNWIGVIEVTAGKVRYVGLSDVPAWVAAQAQAVAWFRGWAPITALQLEYWLLERTPEGELLPMAETLGIGVLRWSPLRGGQLSGKYTRNNGTPADSRRGRFAEPSTPSLDFPASITAEITPMFGFGGATVDGVELPVWPQLLTSSARY